MHTKAGIRRVPEQLIVFVATGLLLATPAVCGTFGRVVAIGGHASDLALDEPRNVLYVANYTANRIEVMSLGDGSIQTPRWRCRRMATICWSATTATSPPPTRPPMR
jgi:hypothetical protein